MPKAKSNLLTRTARSLALIIIITVPLACVKKDDNTEYSELTLVGVMTESMTIASHTKVYVDTDLYIPAGVELILNSDVIMTISEFVAIEVEGSLVINGSGDDRVYLHGVDGEDYWDRINVKAQASVNLNNCTVTGGTVALVVSEAMVNLSGCHFEDNANYACSLTRPLDGSTINSCTFVDNHVGVEITSGAVLIENSHFRDQDANLEIGLKSINSRNIVRSTSFEDNYQGVYSTEQDSTLLENCNFRSNFQGCAYLSNPSVLLRGNSFNQNDYHLFISQVLVNSTVIENNNFHGDFITYAAQLYPHNSIKEAVPAAGNWWGSSDSATVAESIDDAFDDSGADTLRFMPMAGSSF